MTQLALTSLNYSANLLDVIYKGVKKTLQGIMIGYMIARQTSANEKVAQMMIHTGEYRQDDYWSLLNDLNYRTIQNIHKEFGRD
jgi:hypothetical protein